MTNKDHAKHLFKTNAKEKEVFFTKDGQAFFKKQAALAHQKEIFGDKDLIEKITPDDVKEEEATAKKDGNKK